MSSMEQDLISRPATRAVTTGNIQSAPDRASVTSDGDDDDVLDYYVPTWKSWNFSRTLSYWIAILYLEGSTLFVIGGAFSMTWIVGMDERLETGLVDGPYFAGGVCFGLGAYCGVLQVLNVSIKGFDDSPRLIWCGSCRRWRNSMKEVGKSAAAAYLIYFIGALLFQFSVGGGLVRNKYGVPFFVFVYMLFSLLIVSCLGSNVLAGRHGSTWLSTGFRLSQDQSALYSEASSRSFITSSCSLVSHSDTLHCKRSTSATMPRWCV